MEPGYHLVFSFPFTGSETNDRPGWGQGKRSAAALSRRARLLVRSEAAAGANGDRRCGNRRLAVQGNLPGAFDSLRDLRVGVVPCLAGAAVIAAILQARPAVFEQADALDRTSHAQLQALDVTLLDKIEVGIGHSFQSDIFLWL